VEVVLYFDLGPLTNILVTHVILKLYEETILKKFQNPFAPPFRQTPLCLSSQLGITMARIWSWKYDENHALLTHVAQNQGDGLKTLTGSNKYNYEKYELFVQNYYFIDHQVLFCFSPNEL